MFSFGYDNDKPVIKINDGDIDANISDIVFVKDPKDIEKILSNKYVFMELNSEVVDALIGLDATFYIQKDCREMILGGDEYIFAKITKDKTNKTLLQLVDEVY